MSVNKELLTRWAEALESGEYKQTTGRLRGTLDGEEKFCCLGVLCDLSGLGEWQEGTFGGIMYTTADSSSGSVLPLSVAIAAGVNSYVYLGDVAATILNDRDGLTFTEIAKLIRKEYDLGDPK